jgi:hypothetical protein
MDNVQTQKKSRITWQIRELGKAYEDDHFDSANLIN